jgi:hypothetical protein
VRASTSASSSRPIAASARAGRAPGIGRRYVAADTLETTLQLRERGQGILRPRLVDRELHVGHEQTESLLRRVRRAGGFDDGGSLLEPSALDENVAEGRGEPRSQHFQAVALGGVEANARLGLGLVELPQEVEDPRAELCRPREGARRAAVHSTLTGSLERSPRTRVLLRGDQTHHRGYERVALLVQEEIVGQGGGRVGRGLPA